MRRRAPTPLRLTLTLTLTDEADTRFHAEASPHSPAPPLPSPSPSPSPPPPLTRPPAKELLESVGAPTELPTVVRALSSIDATLYDVANMIAATIDEPASKRAAKLSVGGAAICVKEA